MALADDIDQIKDCVNNIHLSQDVLFQEIRQVSKKIDGIKSSGNENTPPKLEIYSELMGIFRLLADGHTNNASLAIQKLTGCGVRDARKLVEIIDVADHD